jgi:hypothetical protein
VCTNEQVLGASVVGASTSSTHACTSQVGSGGSGVVMHGQYLPACCCELSVAVLTTMLTC